VLPTKAVEDSEVVADDDDDEDWTDVDSENDDVTDDEDDIARPMTSLPPCHDKSKSSNSAAGPKPAGVKFARTESTAIKNDWRVLTGHELIDLFKSVHHLRTSEESLTVVGLVSVLDLLYCYRSFNS